MKQTIQSTVSHIFVSITVKKEYLDGLSLNSIMSLRIFMIEEKHMKDEISITAANSMVSAALFSGLMPVRASTVPDTSMTMLTSSCCFAAFEKVKLKAVKLTMPSSLVSKISSSR